MKKLFTLVSILLFSVLIYAQPDSSLIQHIYGRHSLSLNGRWNYIIDPYETGYYDYRRQPYDQSASGKGGYYDDKKLADKSELLEYDFDLSPTITIPGDWNSQVERLQLYEGTLWLRRKFNASPVTGKRYILYFGAANYEAHVYLNGKKLGMHKGGFTPFEFDVTAQLISGENSIVVKVDNTRHPDEIPTVNTDWWNYGGLTRDVMLAEVPLQHILDYKIQLDKEAPFNAKTATINGFIKLANATAGEKITVLIPEAKITQSVVADANGSASFTIAAKNLVYWSPENPKRYSVIVKTAMDSVSDLIGFRKIETRGQDILLNGKSIFLRGISMHDENPLIPGRLRGTGDMRMLLEWAKELNCNYVRLAHYPHSEEMVRLCDELGLLVWAEVPVYWTIAWENPATYQNAEKQLTDLIERDKNRASVIVWSIGNETPLSEPRHLFMGKLAAKAHSLDNTRLVAAALEVHRKDHTVVVDDPLGEKIDLVSFNEYAGWYWGSPAEILDYDFSIKYNKPVVITEFGADALGGFHADAATRFSEEYQAELYRKQLEWLPKIAGLRGMTPWILVDFKSPRRPHPVFQDFWNRKGLISESGKRKLAFGILREFYVGMEKQYR